MQSLLQDIRYGIRMLAKNAGFTAIAVLTLALGIGANTAIFSVVNAELLRPLPFHDPGRLVRVGVTNSRTGWKFGTADYPDFDDWRSQNKVFEKIAAYYENNFTLTGVASPVHLAGEIVSADMFALLGAAPEVGRAFLPAEDEANHFVVVLGDQFWRQQFGGDPGVVGRPITLNNRAYTVVGVMPAAFQFPLQRKPVSVWTTFSADQVTDDSNPPMTKQRGAHFFDVIARLKPGVSLAQAQAAMDVISAGLANQYPDTNKYAGVELELEKDRLTGSIRPMLLILMAAVGLVLLIACMNVASLLLARATTRGREIAIRAALGAGRARVVRQLLTESMLLAGFAGIFGVMIAAWGSALLVRLSPQDFSRAAEIHTDGWVLAFSVGLSLLTGLVFGLAPAVQITRSNLVDALKEGSLSSTAGIHRHQLRSALVILEIAFALVLLVSSGLLIRSLVRLQNVNPGFDPHNVLAADLDLPGQKYTNAKQDQFARELMPKLTALPGMQSVAGVFPLPMTGSEMRTSVQIEGRPVEKSDEEHSTLFSITPDYFRTMKIALLQGRDFTAQDGPDTNPVVIVNESLARQFFPGENPIGKRIRPGISVDEKPSRMREIVGVVADVKFKDLKSEWQPTSYLPQSQIPIGNITVVARTSGDPSILARPLAEAVHSIDPDMPAYNVKTVEDYLDGTIAVPRFNTLLLGIFAGLALVLTAIGLYGVISYSVAQRTHEIGIRMALGGQPRDMLRLVVGQGVRLALYGVGLGLIAAFAFTHFLSSLLFGVTAIDPISFVTVVFALLAVVLLACYIPARRAMNVDPMVALRYE
ncbi:MAG: ABC transporter permease [Candidatus Acidiferrales bacterium]